MWKFLACCFLVLWCGQAEARPRGIIAYPCALAPVSGDGCGVSPGLYFAPAVSSTTPPTAAQWGTYARQSGQTWASDHPQGFNLAAIDYGVGPNALISTFTDIASWPAGQNGCTYFASGTGTGVPANWPSGWPILVCTGATQANFTISGWNFGPTAYQGNPNGSHDCVNLVINPSNTTTYTPTITIKGNAFINGATCAPIISGVRYGLISAVTSNTKASLIVWNNYVDGRDDDAGNCCLVPTNQGFFLSTNSYQANVDLEFNYVLRMPSPPALLGWNTGNESSFPCSNGTAFTNAGYTFTNQYNYFDSFGFTYGGGHWEIATMSSLGTLCARYDQYNTIRWAPTTAAEGASTLFGLTTNNGTAQLWRVKHNTIVTNLVAGRSVPALYEYYDWHTDAGNPNHIVIDGTGSSCSGLVGWTCPGPVRGQSIIGGTNNTFSSQVGLQSNTGTGPITGSAWNGGCNQQDNALGLCPNSGNFPSLAASVLIPSDYPTHKVTNSFFNNRLVSEAGAQADHGTTTNGQFGYGILDWSQNYIDGTGSGTAANSTPTYWEANPATNAGIDYQHGGGGGCAQAATISGNIDLRSGDGTTYPNVNLLTVSGGSC